MIVRDEEQNLEQCLRSVREHVDELIVVDTGSVDGTKQVALRYGARIHDFNHDAHPDAFFIDDEATCRTFSAPPPYSGDVALGDFAAARNESLRHATGDYILWVDADDVVLGGEHLRGCVADMARRDLDFGFLAYDYAVDHAGRVWWKQWRERIMRRGFASWVNHVHEVLLPQRQATIHRYDQVRMSHRRRADRKSIPNRNYKLLLRQVASAAQGGDAGKAWADAKTDPRTLFYLGQEARYVEPQRALGFYHEYLKRSGWSEERAAAHVALGQLYELNVTGEDGPTCLQRAMREYSAAHAEMENNPDGIFGFARIAYLQGRWADCARHTERGLAMRNPDSMLGANPMERLYRPHVYYNHALSKLGRVEEAAASCRAGLEACPDDPGVPGGAPEMLKFNLRVYDEELARRAAAARAQEVPAPAGLPPGSRLVAQFRKDEDVEAPPQTVVPLDTQVIWAMQLWKQAVARGDAARARHQLLAIMPEVAADPVVGRMWASTDRRFAKVEAPPGTANPEAPRDQWRGSARSAASPGRSTVVFWVGPNIEPWDPETPERQGIGGSETACIELARELAERGHSVLVYGCCPGREGTYDGVEYRHWERVQQEAPIRCDVFISSRAPAIMERPEVVQAGIKLLWVHDIHVGPPTPHVERWLYEFDRVLCLSQWHRDFFLATYPWLDPARVLVTRNGIRPERFDWVKVDQQKTNRLFFSSSPNRGLDTLLYNFPFIRARVPDAELHVYYGFDCWEAFARASNNQPELQAIERHREAINQAVRRGGVTYHGRVPQPVLAEAMMRSKVWAYPTAFTETYCTTAAEAQAAGAVPVCSRLAALPETVKHGVLIDPGPDYGNQFIDACVRLLTDEGYRAPIAEAGRRHALENLSWRALAGDWSAMFKVVAAALRERPVPAYREVRA